MRQLDKGLTDVVQSISLSLGVAQVAMQQQSFAQLDQIAAMVNQAMTPEAREDLTADSRVVGEIAAALGLETREVLGQLQFSLQGIQESQQNIEAKLDAVIAAQGDQRGSSENRLAPDDPKAFWGMYFDGKVMRTDPRRSYLLSHPMLLFVPSFSSSLPVSR